MTTDRYFVNSLSKSCKEAEGNPDNIHLQRGSKKHLRNLGREHKHDFYKMYGEQGMEDHEVKANLSVSEQT